MRHGRYAHASPRRPARSPAAALALVLAILLAAPGWAAPGTGWLRFRHASYGFSISYPQGWEVLAGEGTAAFVAIGPAVAGVPQARLGLVVVTARVPSTATLDAAADELQQRLDRDASTVKVLRTDRFTHRGIPALMTYVVRKTPQGIQQYTLLMVLTTGGRGYAVLGTTATGSTQLGDDTTLLQRAMLTFQP